MSDNEQGNQQAESGEELANSLSGGETEFVVSDEKKPATNPMMYLVLVAAVAGGGLWFMLKKPAPGAADAAVVNPEAAKAEETINTFLTSGPSGIKLMQEMMKNTEKVVKQFLDYPSVTQVPLSELHTNPFRSSAKAESAAADADAVKKKEEEKTAAIKASESLQLQSIIHSGSRKACMINNSLYSEGQQVEQFTIEKIEPGRVIVKTGVYRFALKMQR